MKKVTVEFKGDWSDDDIYDFFAYASNQTDQTELGRWVEVGDISLIQFEEYRSLSFIIEDEAPHE